MADAHGSGPCESNLMRVQVPSPARFYKRCTDIKMRPDACLHASGSLFLYLYSATACHEADAKHLRVHIACRYVQCITFYISTACHEINAKHL